MLIIFMPSLDRLFIAAFAPGPGAMLPVWAFILTYNALIPISFAFSAALFATNIATVGLAFNLSCFVIMPPENLDIVFPAKSVICTIVLLNEVYICAVPSLSGVSFCCSCFLSSISAIFLFCWFLLFYFFCFAWLF